MKFICTILILFLSACSSTPSFPLAGISQTYEILGAKVKSPNEPDWRLMQYDQAGIYFGKAALSKDISLISNVVIFAVNEFDDNKAFFEYIISERKKNDDATRFVDLGVNYEFVTFNESSCIKYSSLAEDHASKSTSKQKFQYFSTSGFICRHPANKNVAIQLETSYRSDEKSIPTSISRMSNEFFSGVEFINNTVR